MKILVTGSSGFIGSHVVRELKKDKHSVSEWDLLRTFEGNPAPLNFKDIKEGVLNGRYHLWHGEDACIITEFIEYPKYRVLNVFLGGGDLKKLMIMRKSVEKFGKETGCKKLVASGRKGWLKVFKNSKDTKKVHGYMYAKELV